MPAVGTQQGMLAADALSPSVSWECLKQRARHKLFSLGNLPVQFRWNRIFPLVHYLLAPRAFALRYTEDGSLAQRRCIPDGSLPDPPFVPPGAGCAKIET
jgi:hypothetical protein